jgi:hypothetical protein
MRLAGTRQAQTRQGETRKMSNLKRTSRLAAGLAALSLTALAGPAFLSSGASAASPVAAPTVTTGAVNNVHATSASLNGTVNPNGLPTQFFFQYGPTIAYGSATATATLAAGVIPVKVARPVIGLQPSWHYRIVAVNELGTKVGKDRVFTPQTRLKVTLDKLIGQHVLGRRLVLSGSLSGTGAANHKVILQATPYPYTAPFVNVGTEQFASASGRFTLTVADLSSSSEYRVATVDPRPLYSNAVTVLASVRVIMHVHSTGKLGVVHVFGTVTPAETGAKVFFQLQKEKTKSKTKVFKSEKAEERAEEKGPHYVSQFSATVKHGSFSFSRFSSVLTIIKGGRYRAYVQVRKGPIASGYSSSVLLHSIPAKHKKHKKKHHT